MNRTERRRAVKPREWLDHLRRTDPESYDDAMYLLTTGAAWFENGRLRVREDVVTASLVR